MLDEMKPLEIVHSKRAYNQYKSKMVERINNGVLWLNSRTEEWWDDYAKWADRDRTNILDGDWLGLNLDNLDLNHNSFCVLGQTGGGYYEVARFANMSSTEASHLGFLLDAEEYGYDGFSDGDSFGDAEYSMLTELWIAKIKRLRRERDTALASQIALDRVNDVLHGRASVEDFPGMEPPY